MTDKVTGIEELTKEVNDMTHMFKSATEKQDEQYKKLVELTKDKVDSAEVQRLVKEATAEYAETSKRVQDLGEALEGLSKKMDTPHFSGSEKDAKDADVKASIELQRRIWKNRNPLEVETEFKPDMDNLVDAGTYRKMARRLSEVGLKSRAEIVRGFDADMKKAFDMASLDIAFFSPEMLGIVIDCNIECWSITDLYGQESVSRSTFMYPKIESYGDIGSYECDASCDAELGPEGNIRWLNGKTYDYRGVFCFQKKVLAEANYDILNFMFRAAERSYRINRNQALITGDGVNQPLGWLTADCFRKMDTPARELSGGNGAQQPSFNHVDYRRFISAHPVEYGTVTPVMHQNIFAFLASQTDSNGRFIFGDGDMLFSPDAVRDRLRISNCLPDATEGGTRGDAANPFVPGAFLVAAANWEMAYKAVSKAPLTMEQYEGATTKWCVKYQFGAEDGGFVGCCPAGQILQVGGVPVTP